MPIIQSKTDFINKPVSGPAVITIPKPRMKMGNDSSNSFLKLMLFGPNGSGKTYLIYYLLNMGYKVFVINTDMGGDGLNSVKIPLRLEGKEELLNNLFCLDLESYDDVDSFLDNPTEFVPEIYDLGIDVMFWDGFSFFQQVHLSEKVYENATSAPVKDNKGPSTAARTSGLQFEQLDWGQIRNGTIRPLSAYLNLHDIKNNKLWHKVVTCAESVRTSQEGTRETKTPLLQGAAGILVGHAFDLIIKCKAESVITVGKSEDSTPRVYSYVTAGHENLVSKTRGFKLPSSMEANGELLWKTLLKQLGQEKVE